MGFRYGAEGRTRTGDLLITNQLHYQLCYFGNKRKLYQEVTSTIKKIAWYFIYFYRLKKYLNQEAFH
jgi:hypothetical protein